MAREQRVPGDEVADFLVVHVFHEGAEVGVGCYDDGGLSGVD